MSDLDKLLTDAAANVRAMSDGERDAMLKQQREGYARSEASWPKPKFKIVDGVKVYASYEDYCNG